MKSSVIILSFLLALVCNVTPVKADDATDLKYALYRIKLHVKGLQTLSGTEISEQTTVINETVGSIGDNETILAYALSLVEDYESSAYGPLFMTDDTKSGFSRSNTTGMEIYHAMFAVQQGLIDYAYTPENLSKYRDLFDGARFETSAYFPGAVDAPADASVSYDVKINASQPKAWGSPISGEADPARRPTGCYLAPGSLVTITVPESMVDKGYNVRVGCHSWDHVKKSTIKRLDRVSLVYPIESTETVVANPLGGNIYIEVPYLADAGIVTVQIKNAVRSPFFSARSFDKTSLEEWQNIERKNPGPWADFESDKFMMQVPTSWIYNFDDPVTLMEDWDKAMDAITELRGLPEVMPKTLLYLQMDVQMRGNANYPGYPQANYVYKPYATEDGNKDYWMLKGPQYSDWTVLHELGHYILISKFRGETEALVNFMYVAVQNKKFGMDLDLAYGLSVSGWSQISLDVAATMWMVTDNFRAGNEMSHTNKPGDEFKYQHRGYGKYVEIVDLFGWSALDNFWKDANEDYMGARAFWTEDYNNDPVDSRILRLSKAAGADLRPLIHFWGIQPVDAAQLKADIEAAGLQPSRAIYDKLVHYKSIVPEDNDAFRAHAYVVYPNGPSSNVNPLLTEGTYYTWMSEYDESYGNAGKAAVQAIIDLYFPDGRPDEITTGIEKDRAEGELTLFPNPVQDQLTIQSDAPIEQIRILNESGRLCKRFGRQDDRNCTLDLSSLPGGVYLVVVQKPEVTDSYKIVKL